MEIATKFKNEEDVYRAEKILKTRIRKRKIEYQVKWAGGNDVSWEPQKNILDQRLLDNFKK